MSVALVSLLRGFGYQAYVVVGNYALKIFLQSRSFLKDSGLLKSLRLRLSAQKRFVISHKS